MRTIKTETSLPEQSHESTGLRPTDMSGYIGQEDIKRNLRIAIMSAKSRNAQLDHVLLYGPPGLGKTTLANIIASEMGQNIKYIAGPSIEKAGDIVSALTSLQSGDILFIDEIHRMNIQAEEVLYSAMEDGYISITIGQNGQTKHIKLTLDPFTLVGATTRAGMLSQPLRDRFGHICKLDYYTAAELAVIIRNIATREGMSITDEAAVMLANASRGTPRVAIKLTMKARDFAVANEIAEITSSVAEDALTVANISVNGLDAIDKRLLGVLAQASQPVGLTSLSDMTGEDTGTIELVSEPYLLREGYVEKTARGRIITDKGRLAIGLPTHEENSQLTMFT